MHRPPNRRSASASPPAPPVGAAAAAPPAERFDPHVPGVDYGPLDGLVGYAIRRAQLAIYEDFVRALAPWQITPQRYSALTVIARNRGLKLVELGRILGIARSGAVTVTDALVALGYVERCDNAEDRRAFALALTRRGARALAVIDRAVAEHDARIAARLDAAQKRQLLELLSRLGEPAA